MQLESEYKPELKKRIAHRFARFGEVRFQDNNPNAPGSQGIPDLTVYIGATWSVLEVKRSAKSKKRPNQDYWVAHYATITFSAVIYPENEEEVLNALERSLAARGDSCISVPQ